ncbi:MAG: 5'-deoxyadenosine deaminase [Acidobacteriota bacterium]
MTATLIRGGTLVLPGADGRLRAEPGDLLVSGERIAAVGCVGPIEKPAGDSCTDEASPPGSKTSSSEGNGSSAHAAAATVVDASGCAVLPGFVQTHLHLCQTLFRGAADDLPLLDWLSQRIWPLEAAHDPESMRASARLAVAELLLGGTTAVQTMETVHHTEAALEVLEEAGIFAVAGKCLMDDPETSPEGLVQTTDAALQEAADLAERWDGRAGGRLRYCLAPRFAVSCTDTCLREVGELAVGNGWRVHTHAAENRDEVALVEQRTGFHNVSYLDSVGCTGPAVGLAHCVWVGEEEIALLARTGTHVLHCPGSNCKLGSGVAPVPRLLEAGVSVSLGADGAPCNNTLDMFREMRLAALLQKARSGPDALPAAQLLDLATREGAAALGWTGELGVLAPGAWANVVLVDLERLHSVPIHDPISALVYSAGAADVRSVWLAGRQVVEDGVLILWDEDQVRCEAQRQAGKLFARAGLA